MSALIRKYDAPDAQGGRGHRIVVAVHPTVEPQPVEETADEPGESDAPSGPDRAAPAVQTGPHPAQTEPHETEPHAAQ